VPQRSYGPEQITNYAGPYMEPQNKENIFLNIIKMLCRLRLTRLAAHRTEEKDQEAYTQENNYGFIELFIRI